MNEFLQPGPRLPGDLLAVARRLAPSEERRPDKSILGDACEDGTHWKSARNMEELGQLTRNR
jgi:hypothetical protein